MKGHKCELPGCNKDIPSWRHRKLSWIVDHYGYEVLVNLNDLTFLNINWAIKPDVFQRDGITGTKVKDLGFIISKPNHIIIYKL
jgi:hypothetical protein